MKKRFWIFGIIAFFFFVPSIFALEFDLYSKNAILYNLDEQKILYEKEADEQIAIASLTKIMTAIVAVEKIDDLDNFVNITSEDLKGLEEANASTAGFFIGETVTYKDLLYGLLLPSGADAAQALTRVVAGSKEKFVNLMNEKAKELNLKNTHFANETGLDEQNHYSTLKEVGIMFQYALQNETLKTILTTSHYTMSDHKLSVKSTILKNMEKYKLDMDYLNGGKTGTTENAGLCLASIAKYNGTNYMLITARAKNDKTAPYSFYDTKTIYEYFMNHFENKTIIEKEDIILSLKTQYAKEEQIQWKAKETIEKYVPKEYQKQDLEIQYDGIQNIKYNTKVGTKLGNLKILYQKEEVYITDIILESALHFDIGKYMYEQKLIFISLGIIFLFLFIFLRIRKRKRNFTKL